MIRIENVSKTFEDVRAIDNVSVSIQDSSVFGLIGTNGSGKSTLLRMIAGILQPDEGRVLLDEQQIYENMACKSRCFYISDEQYFFANCTPEELKNYYQRLYPQFDCTRFSHLIHAFGLSEHRKIRTFSKGMKKQVSAICGVCAQTDYLFCDEIFDGLDPVMRQAVKALFADDMSTRGMTPVIASHNLRELEDICDHIGLLHHGGILFSRDLDEMKLDIHKLQCIFTQPFTPQLLGAMQILHIENRGSLYTITARGNRETLQKQISALQPVFFEMLPLTLEEIFISETEVAGYDVKNLILSFV